MRRSVFSAVCAAIAILFLCFPSLFLMQAQNKVICKWLYGSRLAYEGELSVWTVDVNADGKNALYNWLAARSVFYKQRHFGIYPVLEQPMTMEQARDRMASGEVPDILLCGGNVPPDVLNHAASYEGPFPMPLMLPQYENGLLTPVMRSGTVVLINDDVLYAAGLNPPDGLEGMDGQWVEYATEELPGAFAYDDALSLMAVVLSDLPQQAQEAFLSASPAGIEDFICGHSAVFVTSLKSLWYLYRQELLGKPLPSVASYPLCGFVPRVQYAVLMHNGDAKRQEAAGAFIAVLIGKTAQTALSDIYALPVVYGAKCERADLMDLWQCEMQTEYVFCGHGEEEFMAMVNTDSSIEDLRAYASGLCRSP